MIPESTGGGIIGMAMECHYHRKELCGVTNVKWVQLLERLSIQLMSCFNVNYTHEQLQLTLIVSHKTP